MITDPSIISATLAIFLRTLPPPFSPPSFLAEHLYHLNYKKPFIDEPEDSFWAENLFELALL
jgi:hypothetical protein